MAIAIVEHCSEDRFYLKFARQEAFPSCQVYEFSYGQDALAFLMSPDRLALDLIFVDISMPRMDGFEFADAFHGLYPELKGAARLFILFSSIDPRDHESSGCACGDRWFS